MMNIGILGTRRGLDSNRTGRSTRTSPFNLFIGVMPDACPREGIDQQLSSDHD